MEAQITLNERQAEIVSVAMGRQINETIQRNEATSEILTENEINNMQELLEIARKVTLAVAKEKA